ncbi:MAG: GAF domain-containing protein, partial [candidate division NC10 bacterium]|nr:GAF domain-containing protein [candidate division NC10 bacterium]
MMRVNERNDAEGLRILIAHALESVREIVTITDLDDRFTFVNQAFLDAFGYTPDEVLGQHVSLIDSPNNPAGLHAEIFAQSRLGGWKGELLNRTKAGREFPIALSTSCIRDGSGKILGLIGIAEDITLRRQAAQALVSRTKQIEGIRAVSEEILRELDLATVLTLIIQRAADLTGAGSGMVYLWDEEAQVLLPAAWHGGGEWREELRLRPGQGVAGTVALRREGMVVNDYRNSPYAQAITLEHSQISTVLGEPLLSRDALVGVIVVDKEGDGAAFTAKDRETLALFAAQAAIAIENARLHTDVVGRGQELEALLRATRSVMSGLDLQHILQRIVAEASQMAGTQHVSVMLVDKAAQVLRVAALAGDPVPVGFHVPLGVDLSGLVAQAGQPVFSPDSPNDPRNLLAERDRELGFVTYFGLPIKIRDEVLGVLTFDTTVPRHYSPEEVAYLASFADQAAIAIENA